MLKYKIISQHFVLFGLMKWAHGDLWHGINQQVKYHPKIYLPEFYNNNLKNVSLYWREIHSIYLTLLRGMFGNTNKIEAGEWVLLRARYVARTGCRGTRYFFLNISLIYSRKFRIFMESEKSLTVFTTAATLEPKKSEGLNPYI
jgi:hypothetical protein